MTQERIDFELNTGHHLLTGKLVNGIATVFTFDTETDRHSRYDGHFDCGSCRFRTTSNHRAEWFALLENYVEDNLDKIEIIG